MNISPFPGKYIYLEADSDVADRIEIWPGMRACPLIDITLDCFVCQAEGRRAFCSRLALSVLWNIVTKLFEVVGYFMFVKMY